MFWSDQKYVKVNWEVVKRTIDDKWGVAYKDQKWETIFLKWWETIEPVNAILDVIIAIFKSLWIVDTNAEDESSSFARQRESLRSYDASPIRPSKWISSINGRLSPDDFIASARAVAQDQRNKWATRYNWWWWHRKDKFNWNKWLDCSWFVRYSLTNAWVNETNSDMTARLSQASLPRQSVNEAWRWSLMFWGKPATHVAIVLWPVSGWMVRIIDSSWGRGLKERTIRVKGKHSFWKLC